MKLFNVRRYDVVNLKFQLKSFFFPKKKTFLINRVSEIVSRKVIAASPVSSFKMFQRIFNRR
jgi:hypothetical protein